MAIAFTDDNIKALTKAVLEASGKVDALNTNKAGAIAKQADYLTNDDLNKVYYNNEKNILAQYYLEHASLNGTTYTSYSDATLENSAKQLPGNLHYPSSPAWVPVKPKALAENTGGPITSTSPNEASPVNPDVTTAANFLKNGWSDGATTTTTNLTYSGGAVLNVTSISGFAAGQRIAVRSGANDLYAIVTGSGGIIPNEFLTITQVAGPTGSLGSGATVTNFFSGFPNNQREHTVSTNNPNLRTYAEAQLDSKVSTYSPYLSNQTTYLNANDATGAEATEISTAKTNVNTMTSAISTWQAAPTSGAGTGRYGDTKLNTFLSAITTRLSQTTTRSAEITNRLGTLTQNITDGTFSGTGRYYSFFKYIDFRCGKSDGSLFMFYNMDLIIKFIDEQIAQANAKKAEYDQYAIVAKITENTTVIPDFKVSTITGFSIGNTVKVMDNTASPIITTTITNISGSVITLAVAVPGLVVDNLPRIAKLL